MPHFLAVYTGTAASRAASGWDALDLVERESLQAKGMQAWHDWMEANTSRVVLSGGPLGPTKRISSKGVSDANNHLTGFVVIEAESHDAAAALFEGHPHFSIFPGDAVEVMECLPVPS